MPRSSPSGGADRDRCAAAGGPAGGGPPPDLGGLPPPPAACSRLADGRPSLVGERFSAADLAFAALAGAVLMPPQWGVPLPRPDELPPVAATKVRHLREHPAGRFALRMFEQERPA